MRGFIHGLLSHAFCPIAVMLVPAGCVRATPMGSIDGRPVFKLDCPTNLSSSCDNKARKVCGGDYEPLSSSTYASGAMVTPVGNSAMVATANRDQMFVACGSGPVAAPSKTPESARHGAYVAPPEQRHIVDLTNDLERPGEGWWCFAERGDMGPSTCRRDQVRCEGVRDRDLKQALRDRADQSEFSPCAFAETAWCLTFVNTAAGSRALSCHLNAADCETKHAAESAKASTVEVDKCGEVR